MFDLHYDPIKDLRNSSRIIRKRCKTQRCCSAASLRFDAFMRY
ncbi:hypothetical protein [Ruegeria sp. AU67]|nr:hypothetical protein [Ruegeria sp. AU67]